MAWLPQALNHIQIFYVSGSKIKVRPGIITANVGGNTVNAKVGHTSQTFASLPRRVTPTAQVYPCYIPM
jgi:hypothetical protein